MSVQVGSLVRVNKNCHGTSWWDDRVCYVQGKDDGDGYCLMPLGSGNYCPGYFLLNEFTEIDLDTLEPVVKPAITYVEPDNTPGKRYGGFIRWGKVIDLEYPTNKYDHYGADHWRLVFTDGILTGVEWRA